MKYPKRHSNHSLEEMSMIFFRQHLPADWNPNTVDRDYGQDLNIEISEDGEYRGLELVVQLKSSDEPNPLGEFERQTFQVSTFNYLRANLRVVLIVKYILAENEAYYILLKDIEDPNQNNESFTINLPRENRLSTINWKTIATYVREVTEKKLAVNRPPSNKKHR